MPNSNIDKIPSGEHAERSSRRKFLENAGLAVLAGAVGATLAACDNPISNDTARRADYGPQEPSSIELTDEERNEIDNLARTAASNILEHIEGGANHLQKFFPEACAMLYMSDDRYEFKVQQSVPGCEHDPNIATRILVTVKPQRVQNSNQPRSGDQIMLESPLDISGDGNVTLEEIKLLLRHDKTRLTRLLSPRENSMELIFNDQEVSNYYPNKVNAQQITDYIRKTYAA